MERIFPTEKLIPTILWPITGLATGTPVLIRKLTAPQRERRAEAAALKAKQAELDTQAAAADEAAFAKKLTAEADPAKRDAMLRAREAAAVAARQYELEQAKAARKETRSKLGDAAGAAALMLIVGGPLIWSLARPWIQPTIGLAIGAWWIAALIHAPAPGKTAPAKAGQESHSAGQESHSVGQEDQDEPVPATEEEPVQEDRQEAPEVTAPTPADARHAVALLGADGTHVALTAVTAHLAAAHPRWERSGKATKALLAQAGIRYRGGVKVDGVSVPGIHHDDVPPLPSPSESAPGRVVVPGQSNNNNHNNADEWVSREGYILRADPDNPARTIVVHSADAA